MIPLQEAVIGKEEREKFPAVNRRVISSIVAFYIVFAVTCWAAFGSTVRTALTASLPPGAYSTSVQFAYSIAIIFSFPLQNFPALEVVFHSSTGSLSGLERNIVASIITCFLGVVAYVSIDYLGNVVSLLGSLVGIPIALIYPPLIHNKLVKSNGATKLLNNCVACLGVVAMGAASYTTIASWEKGADG